MSPRLLTTGRLGRLSRMARLGARTGASILLSGDGRGAAREQVLSAPLDRLFAEWDDAPIASASIGQVHRARLHDGRSVAVKVQHPGIERAIESDLNNAGVLEGVVGKFAPASLNSRQVYAQEVRP